MSSLERVLPEELDELELVSLESTSGLASKAGATTLILLARGSDAGPRLLEAPASSVPVGGASDYQTTPTASKVTSTTTSRLDGASGSMEALINITSSGYGHSSMLRKLTLP